MSNLIDLTGKRFGHLVVLGRVEGVKGKPRWHCKCDCGNEKDILGSSLRKGQQSCGCMKKKLISKANTLDITGKKFNRLTALYPTKEPKWMFRCDCGREKEIDKHRVTTGKTKSCGCLTVEKTIARNVIDLTGKRFGSLVAIELDHIKDHKYYWKLQCDCGNIVVRRNDQLKDTSSCGCNRKGDIDFSIIGKRFGKLVVTSFHSSDGQYSKWNCHCDCGNDTVVYRNGLISGHTRSCGCLNASVCLGSTPELEIKNYISDIVPDNTPKKKRILDGKEIDLYYEDLGIGVEFNGSAFHASINGAYINHSKTYHRDKFIVAKDKGIRLITIFDMDWYLINDNIKYLLRDAFSKKIKIGGRQCFVCTIDKVTARDFCTQYHVHGFNNLANINYGLYHGSELVSVMSFGGLRMHKFNGVDYELYRYCTKESFVVIGGANKLLRAFEVEYNPRKIRSYSDNDFFTGDIYPKLGFKCLGQAEIDYYWNNNANFLTREQCQLKKLADKYPDLYAESCGNREDYIMSHLNYRKVYRCGNTIWEKDYTEVTN